MSWRGSRPPWRLTAPWARATLAAVEDRLPAPELSGFLKHLGFPALRVHAPFNHFDFARPSRRILVIGTSMKMLQRIVATLGLPPITRVITIEEVSTREEIDRALRVRAEQGKHIIPVPAVEVKRSYPHIFFESVKVLLTGGRGIRRKRPREVVEKTVVRPPYSRLARRVEGKAQAPAGGAPGTGPSPG